MSVFKGGWHPDKKDGGGSGLGKKMSARSDFKGVNQIAGWMGKGKDTSQEWEAGKEHHAAPLSTLKDPASFGPPPKHIQAHGPQAASSSSRPSVSATPTSTSSRMGSWARPQPTSPAQSYEQQEYTPASQAPYRAPATGLHTNDPPRSPMHSETTQSPAGGPPSKPSLPPRLPPRQNSRPDVHTASPPPAYNEVYEPSDTHVNQGAAARLGKAGVSVPGFGIGGRSSDSASGDPKPASNGQLNELQSRFAKLGRTASPSNDAESQPSAGTTWAQKQSALQTAASFRKDPSSVSMKDAREAASTANNFRQRHGEQVASGWKTANGLGQKYGIADRLGGVSPAQMSPSAEAAGQAAANPSPSSSAAETGQIAGRKPPPPKPPPKKKSLQGETGGGAEPPPIPLASKPRR